MLAEPRKGFFVRFLEALSELRRRQADREISKHAHLLSKDSWQQLDLWRSGVLQHLRQILAPRTARRSAWVAQEAEASRLISLFVAEKEKAAHLRGLGSVPGGVYVWHRGAHPVRTCT